MRVLLIEDDTLIGDGLKIGLSKQGFAVDWCTDGALGRDALRECDYDAVVLDLTLPRVDGLDILRQWRATGYDVPVLVLTARDAIPQKVEGLNSGADDYVCKPFALEEVCARLHALVRRRHGQSAEVCHYGALQLDVGNHTLTLDGAPVSLSPKAVALVELFVQQGQGGKVFSRESLEDKLYPWGEEVSSNTVEVHIHNIRRKLGSQFIKTVYGVGYTLGEKP